MQYVPLATETLTYDADGNLKTDGRFTYTWDAADRLIRMQSAAFYQPVVVAVAPATSPASALVNVPAKVIEFAYDGLSRRIRKKVTEGASTIAVWEADVYDGWNMVLSVKLNPAAGACQGRPQSAIASYVQAPDLGSQPIARRDWQAAGGVRGLVMLTVTCEYGGAAPDSGQATTFPDGKEYPPTQNGTPTSPPAPPSPPP